MIGKRVSPPIVGPRESVVKHLQGVPPGDDEVFIDHPWQILRAGLFDTSEWMVCTHTEDLSELWVDDVHDFVGEELADY